MFSTNNDRWLMPAASFCLLLAVVYGAVDAILARVSVSASCLPDDESRCFFIGAIELVQDKAAKTPFPWQEKRGMRVCQHAIANGVWLRPLVNVIVLMPPLSVTLAELDRICTAAEEGIKATLPAG